MKRIREYLNEEFRKDSDPIEDLGIGYAPVLIQKGTQLPDDFITEDGNINFERYIIERGYTDDPNWDDATSYVSVEWIGSVIIGAGKFYAPIRYRRRKSIETLL